MSNSIINSIKRLERIGNENSKAVQKIKDACIETGKYIIENNLLGHLPGYTAYAGTIIDQHGTHIDKNMKRETAMEFAKNIYESKIGEVIINSIN